MIVCRVRGWADICGVSGVRLESMPDLIYDDHARDEMRRDAVTEDDVYFVVADADVEYVRNDGRGRYERLMEDGRHVVVIVETATGTVKTVWWDKRGSRRHRRWN